MNTTEISSADLDAISDRCTGFIVDLTKDGERAAVILAAARIDTALEDLLRAVFIPCAGGQDDLFDSERAISTFSAKITAAYRLGLVDRDFERLLQIIRKIRNEFAHAHNVVSLQSGPSSNRVLELQRACVGNGMFDKLEALLKQNSSQNLSFFIAAAGLVLSKLEAARVFAIRYNPQVTASIHQNEK